MSILSKLFGGGGGQKSPPAEPEIYKDYTIFPEPANEGGGYRIGARIEKEMGGEVRVHKMIRADSYASAETATEASLAKARQLIDLQGDSLFE